TPLRQALLPSGGTSRVGGRSCQRPTLQAADLAEGLPLAALQRAAATCSLATGGCPWRSSRGQQALVAWPLAAAPCELATTVHAREAAATTGGRPCKGAGHGHARLSLARASFIAKT
ncbi:hypothetical protein BHE74_00023485, partial [Ensete ventricosum]